MHNTTTAVLRAVEKSKMSLGEIFGKAKVSRPLYYKWKTGTSPSVDKLDAVARVVGVEIVARKGKA